MANRMMSRSKRIPREPIAGAAMTRVSKIICNFFARFINLNTTKTLRIRIVVAYVAISSLMWVMSRITAIVEKMTTVKSKTFQLSLK